MTVVLTINGGLFPYPELSDSDWGIAATAAIVALSTSTLQKSGGLFTLTDEVDFGANFGLQALYLTSRTTDSAATGILRLSQADSIAWRNTANNDNLSLEINTNDQLVFNGKVLDTSTIIISNPLVGSDGITIISGTNTTTVSGFHDEFVSASGLFVEKTGDTMTGKLSTSSDIELATGNLILGFNDEIQLGTGGFDVKLFNDTAFFVIDSSNIGGIDIIADGGIDIIPDTTVGTSISGAIFVAEADDKYSQFGADPTSFPPSNNNDMLVVRKERKDGVLTGTRRGFDAILDINNLTGTLVNAASNFGLNAFVYTHPEGDAGSNRTTGAGAANAGRYAFRHRGAGLFAMGGGVASTVQLQDVEDGIVTDAYGYLDEGGDGGAGTGELSNYHGLWIKDSIGRIETKRGIWIEDLTNASGSNIGICIDGADTNAIWLGAGSEVTTAADGITFGSGKDVNLYRSAADTLKTDDDFEASRVTAASGIFSDTLTVSGIPVTINISSGDFVQKAGDTMTGDLDISAAQIIISSGTTNANSIYFEGDADTGFYSSAQNTIDIVTNSVTRILINEDSIGFSSRLLSFAGSVAEPHFSNVLDPNSGLYARLPDVWGISTGGISALEITANQIVTVPSGLTVSGLPVRIDSGNISPLITITADTVLTQSDAVILANASSGVILVTLPTTSGNVGRNYSIKKIDSTANLVTISGINSETIDGALTAVLTAQYESLPVVTDGTSWFIL